MQLRNHRDFWSGMMFIAIGLLFIALSQQYQFGTSAKMGPGYFPTVLGGLMAFLGVLICLEGMGKHAVPTKLSPIGWRELILVLVAVVAFAAALPYLGMVLALAILISISALASHEFRPRDTILSIVFLTILSYVVFVYGLELQFPVWPKFLGPK